MGHISAMKYLVRLPGIKLTQTDQYSRNALHLASISGKTEAVRVLLQHLTITISAVDEDGRTALHYAVMRGHGLIAELLLPRASSDILREDFEILSPLDHAVRLDSISMVKTLIDSMLPDDPLRHRSAALLHSLRLPRIEILRILLSSGYFNLNLGDHSGRTVLHIAVIQCYWLSDPLSSARDAAMSRLNLLLNTTGINVNARDDEERTPKSYVRDALLQKFIGPALTPGFDAVMEARNTKREVEETMLQMLIDAGAEY
ncbi:hypothetical protein LA080_002622 [Diaporthe eres]|nr:hypothetical protein LA080_002622 [Diaporthe eres]